MTEQDKIRADISKIDISSTDNKIPERYQRAIILIAHGSTVTAAAKEIGISRGRLSHMLNNNVYMRAELASLQAEVTGQITNNLCRLSEKAISTVFTLLDSEDVPADARLKAAVSVISKLMDDMKLPKAHYTDPEAEAKYDYRSLENTSVFYGRYDEDGKDTEGYCIEQRLRLDAYAMQQMDAIEQECSQISKQKKV